jgi:membrane protease subunit HflK
MLEARGEATRFEALLEEYLRAPEVTRRRLYLETMEVVLPNVEMVIVEPNTVNLMPYFPLGGRRGERERRPPPVSQSPPAGAGETQ